MEWGYANRTRELGPPRRSGFKLGAADNEMQLPHCHRKSGQYLVITGNYWAFTLTDGAATACWFVLALLNLGYSRAANRDAIPVLKPKFLRSGDNLVSRLAGRRNGAQQHQ